MYLDFIKSFHGYICISFCFRCSVPGTWKGAETVTNRILVAENGNLDIAKDCPLVIIEGLPPSTSRGCLLCMADGSLTFCTVPVSVKQCPTGCRAPGTAKGLPSSCTAPATPTDCPTGCTAPWTTKGWPTGCTAPGPTKGWPPGCTDNG